MILSLCTILVFCLIGITHSMPLNMANFSAYIVIASIFIITLSKKVTKEGVSTMAFVYIGAISYPLYLLHQDIGLIFLKISKDLFNKEMSKILVLIGVIFLSVLVHELFEKRAISWLKKTA